MKNTLAAVPDFSPLRWLVPLAATSLLALGCGLGRVLRRLF